MKTEVNIAVPSRRSVGKRGTAYVLLGLFALVARALVPGCGRCDAADFSLQLDAEAGGGAVGGLMASAIGGLLMMFADWCGRMVMFPNQIPVGLQATFIGAPYFIWLLRRQGR